MPSQMNGDLHNTPQVPIWNSRPDPRLNYLRSQGYNNYNMPSHNYNPGCRFVYILLSLSTFIFLFQLPFLFLLSSVFHFKSRVNQNLHWSVATKIAFTFLLALKTKFKLVSLFASYRRDIILLYLKTCFSFSFFGRLYFFF